MSKFKKPRLWSDPTGCSATKVLFDPGGRNEGQGEAIYMNTNLGWVGPVEVSERENGDPTAPETLEQAAESIAKGYELEERPRERAIAALGYGEEEDYEL